MMDEAKILNKISSIDEIGKLKSYKLIVELAQDAIFVKDLESRYILVNQKTLEAFGNLPREKVIGKNDYELLPPEQAKVNIEDDQKVFKAGRPFEIAKRMSAGGKEFYFQALKVPLKNEEDKIIGLIGIARDVTEHKQAEEALQEAKTFAESLIASMKDGFSTLNNQGVHIDVNAALCQVTGFSKEELIGVGPPHPYWPPEEYKEIEKAFQKTLRGEFADFELTFMRKNGERFPVIVSPSWIKDNQGNVISYFATVKDITERKKAEEEIKNYQKKIDTVINSSSDLILLKDKDFKYLIANKAHEKLFNIKIKDIIAKTDFDFMPKQVAEGCRKSDKEALESEEPIEREEFVDNKCFQVVKQRVVDATGNIMGIAAVIRDITERKQREEKIKLFSRAIEGAIDAKTITDREGIITYINPSMEKLYGYKKGELIGKSVKVLNPDPKMAEHIMSALIKTGTWSGETLQQKKNKEIFPALLSLSTVKDEKGNLIATLGVVRDITDLKKAQEALQHSEEYFRSLIENVQDIVVILGADGKIQYVSPSVERILEYKAKRLKDKDVLKYVHPDDVVNVIDLFTFGIQNPGYAKTLEFRLRHKSGSWHVFEGIGKNLLENLAIQGVIINCRDITARKQTEEKIKQEKKRTEELLSKLDSAHEKLKEAQDELIKRQKIETTGTLAAGVAHEIRNPLAIIGMTVQYLQSKLSENDPKRELTEAIIKKVEKLDRVTRELSSYGRTMKLNIRRHNLARCLNLNLALIKPKCRVQKVKVKKRYSRLPLIEMDDEQMDKVFLNIIDNAMRVMSHGGILSVSTEFDEQAKQAVIRIHNTGSVIKKKHLPHIFEPFYTIKKKDDGTGLGLAIAQNVAIRHGTQIAVENKSSGKDKGVAFIIRLPVNYIERE